MPPRAITSGQSGGTVVQPTHYTYRLPPSQYTTTTAPPPASSSTTVTPPAKQPGPVKRSAINLSVRVGQPQRAQGYGIFGSPRIIAFAWLVAMGVIGYDEWHNNHIFPRPARLWWATLFFGLLAAAGQITAIMPLTNALAVGYAIMLLWQFYNQEGQFSG